MKKVLIISYHFPPSTAIGGLRTCGLTKYLHEFGWDAIVLTKKMSGHSNIRNKILHTRFSEHDSVVSLKKVLGLNTSIPIKRSNSITDKNKISLKYKILRFFVYEIVAYPDKHKGWYKYAVEVGNELFENEKIDAIISSSSPEISHIIANNLKLKYAVPWIADLRDLWTQNHYYQYSPIRTVREKRLEIMILSNADALTTVSQPLAEKLKELHKAKMIHSIPNGFDPAEKIIVIPSSEKFSITYTGSIYVGKQDPMPLFKALQELISEKVIEPDDVTVDFYGYNEGWLERDAEYNGMQSIVKIHDPIPRNEVIKKQRESQLLLLLTWNDPNEKGIYTGKVFEYLAAQRPIISIGISGDVVEDLLKKTNAGIQLSSVDEIKEEIKNAYLEFKSNGKVSYHGIPCEIDKYSHREMARKFAKILDTMMKT